MRIQWEYAEQVYDSAPHGRSPHFDFDCLPHLLETPNPTHIKESYAVNQISFIYELNAFNRPIMHKSGEESKW